MSLVLNTGCPFSALSSAAVLHRLLCIKCSITLPDPLTVSRLCNKNRSNTSQWTFGNLRVVYWSISVLFIDTFTPWKIWNSFDWSSDNTKSVIVNIHYWFGETLEINSPKMARIRIPWMWSLYSKKVSLIEVIFSSCKLNSWNIFRRFMGECGILQLIKWDCCALYNWIYLWEKKLIGVVMLYWYSR